MLTETEMATIRSAHKSAEDYHVIRSDYADETVTQETLTNLPRTPDNSSSSGLTAAISDEVEIHDYLRDLYGNGVEQQLNF